MISINVDKFRIISVMLMMLLSIFTSLNTFADEASIPDGWPWRGVSIAFPGSSTEDVERYKKNLDLNIVRLNVNVRQYAKSKNISKEQAWESAMLWTDSMLDACARLGIRATVEVNQFSLDPAHPERMNTPRYWDDENMLNELYWVAGRLAERYASRGAELAAYQVLSEPLILRNGRATSPPKWRHVLDRIIAEIRMFDKERWIVVSPGPGGGPHGYESFVPSSDRYLIWGAHMYLPHAFTHQGIKGKAMGGGYPGMNGWKYWDKDSLRAALEPLKQFQKQYPGPVFIGEFSAVRWAAGGEQYVIDLASIFDEYNWGWTYFSATGWHGMNPDYDDKHSSDDPTEWKAHFVGNHSLRWQTLRSIFKTEGINK